MDLDCIAKRLSISAGAVTLAAKGKARPEANSYWRLANDVRCKKMPRLRKGSASVLTSQYEK
jgi:hypothetical protein